MTKRPASQFFLYGSRQVSLHYFFPNQKLYQYYYLYTQFNFLYLGLHQPVNVLLSVPDSVKISSSFNWLLQDKTVVLFQVLKWAEVLLYPTIAKSAIDQYFLILSRSTVVISDNCQISDCTYYLWLNQSTNKTWLRYNQSFNSCTAWL